MLCLAVYTGESLVADVHDGDATAAELLVAGAHDAARHAQTASADLAESGTAALHHDTETLTVGDGGQDGHSGDTSPGSPVHTQHACHCAHAHGFVDAAPRPDEAIALSDLTAPAAQPVRMPPSLEREPQLRPPIIV